MANLFGLKSPLDELLKKPIPLPEVDVPESSIQIEIGRLEARRLAYKRLSSTSLLPTWNSIVSALTEIRDQYSQKLLHAKGREIVEAQEAVKAYNFLISMPERAEAIVRDIDEAIARLREFSGIGIDGR